MYVSEEQWSQTEKEVAKRAFEKAYHLEIERLTNEVKIKANTIHHVDDIWQLHDFLSARRHDIDGKYDYRYSSLIFVFAQLVQDGLLSMEELEGLAQDKCAKIAALSRM